MKIEDTRKKRDEDEFVIYLTRKEGRDLFAALRNGSMNDLWHVGETLVATRDALYEAFVR